ncbi:MAG: YbjQ family protein, partial [Sedimentisphaerales bacterium]|nr:YbjQ family protein [Sedimentisphaerales bacterium]
TIRARHIGRDIIAVLRNFVGGEISDYTKMIAESREQAIDRMIEEAQKLGANAIIGVRFSTTEVMQGAAEIMVFGTAVVVE